MEVPLDTPQKQVLPAASASFMAHCDGSDKYELTDEVIDDINKKIEARHQEEK